MSFQYLKCMCPPGESAPALHYTRGLGLNPGYHADVLDELDVVLGDASRPATLNQFAYCLNDPINRMDKDGQWSFKKLLKSIVSTATSIVGNVVEAAVDIVVTIVETAIEVVQKAIDIAVKFIEDVKEAVEDVAEVVYTGFQVIQKAWDNLDSGLKQWIITGITIAASFALPGIGGMLVACLIDGTFSDMWNAIKNGDWKQLALIAGGIALAGVGAKVALKLLKAGQKSLAVGGKLAKLRAKSANVFKFENRPWDVSKSVSKKFGQFMKVTEGEMAGTGSKLRTMESMLDRHLLHSSMTVLERGTSVAAKTGLHELIEHLERPYLDDQKSLLSALL